VIERSSLSTGSPCAQVACIKCYTFMFAFARLRSALERSLTATHNSVIRDSYETLGEVQNALRSKGLTNAALVLGVDFTKSNEWTGTNSFSQPCLHTIVPQGAPAAGPAQRRL
jgi:hypothetical protein